MSKGFRHEHGSSIPPSSGELGSLERVKRIVKLVGFVNCADGFAQQPSVINGASDFFVQVCLGLPLTAPSPVNLLTPMSFIMLPLPFRC